VTELTARPRLAELAPIAARTGAAFRSIIGRDLRVLRRNLPGFAAQVIMQPLLLVFTFTYVLPHVTAGGFGAYATLLVPGLIAATAFSTGISTVTTPLAADLGGTREIDDRILAPITIQGVALEKVLIGAVYAWISAALVLPMSVLVSATPVHLHVANWPVLVAAVALVGLTSSALGLTIGTIVKPQQIGILYGIFVIPVQSSAASTTRGQICSTSAGFRSSPSSTP
jgi:ABC-2 type transport system permease protein